MLNAIQECKRCNRLVIIPLTEYYITFQVLIRDHFGVDVKRNWDHFRVGDHFRGRTVLKMPYVSNEYGVLEVKYK